MRWNRRHAGVTRVLQIKLLPYEYGPVLKVTLETPADSEHYPRTVIMIDSKLGLPEVASVKLASNIMIASEIHNTVTVTTPGCGNCSCFTESDSSSILLVLVTVVFPDI